MRGEQGGGGTSSASLDMISMTSCPVASEEMENLTEA